MSATHTTPVPQVTSVREDLITVAVPGRTPGRDVMREARKLAAGAAHTLVGGAQNVRPGKLDGRVITLADFAPVRRRQAGQAPAASVDDLRAREVAELRARLAELTGEPAPKAPRRPREVPPKIAARIAASHALACKTCRDLGVVRGVGANAGKAYRTRNGADAAKAAGRAVPCPDHKRASKSA